MQNAKKISYKKLIILIVSIILLLIIGIAITMARYTSTGSTEVLADIAFFVFEEGFQEGNIMLSNLYPNEDSFIYEFSIANTDGERVAEVSTDYDIELVITTNLPLELKIYKKDTYNTTYEELTIEDGDIENNIVLDESNQCYVRKIKIKKGSLIFSEAKTDTYKLEVTFPIEYNNIEEFEGMIDNVAITVNAQQK